METPRKVLSFQELYPDKPAEEVLGAEERLRTYALWSLRLYRAIFADRERYIVYRSLTRKLRRLNMKPTQKQ